MCEIDDRQIHKRHTRERRRLETGNFKLPLQSNSRFFFLILLRIVSRFYCEIRFLLPKEKFNKDLCKLRQMRFKSYRTIVVCYTMFFLSIKHWRIIVSVSLFVLLFVSSSSPSGNSYGEKSTGGRKQKEEEGSETK